MRIGRGVGGFVNALCAAAMLLMSRAALAQAPLPPLPDGYMRAAPVPTGLAPKMRVTETAGTAHVFDAHFSAGDEILSGLTDLALQHGITAGYITGLGGVSDALLVWGDPKVGAFKKIVVEERGELASLSGHIQMRDGKPVVHLHAVVSFGDGSTQAGHVVEAHVQPLAEIAVIATATDGAAAARGADEAAIRAVIQAFIATREANDVAGLTALLTADADQRQTSGTLRSGRDAVVSGSLATTQSTGGRRTITVDSLRFLGPDVALADGRYDSVGRADGSDQRMLTSMLLRREEGAWKIAAIRNALPTAP